MKKFATKRGFTIVEILVAFVIFAIMAAMISTILMSTNQIKKENLDLEAEIEAQRNAYYLSELDEKYDSANKAGSLSFKFDGIGEFAIDYENGDPNDASADNQLALLYPVGDVTYSNLKDGMKDDGTNGKKEEGGKAVTDRLDARIYGDEQIDWVSVRMEYVGAKDGGHMYLVYSNCYSKYFDENDDDYYRPFSQYRLVFPSPIIDYGYFYKSGETFITKSLEEDSADNAPKSDAEENWDIFCPVRKMPLLYDKVTNPDTKELENNTKKPPLLYGSIIRVASQMTDTQTLYDYNEARFFVVLQDKLAYDSSDKNVPEYKKWNIDDMTTIFGTCGTEMISTNMEHENDLDEDEKPEFLKTPDANKLVYKHYNEKGVGVHQNIFGGFPVKDYDTSTP